MLKETFCLLFREWCVFQVFCLGSNLLRFPGVLSLLFAAAPKALVEECQEQQKQLLQQQKQLQDYGNIAKTISAAAALATPLALLLLLRDRSGRSFWSFLLLVSYF